MDYNSYSTDISGIVKGISDTIEFTAADRTIHKPIFLSLMIQEDRNVFFELLPRLICITDEIYYQLKDLIKSRNPTRNLSDDDYKILIDKHLDGVDLYSYGTWVYYPWNRKMVHILNKDEFIEVRTSRNQYKITAEEQEQLATKKVGVIGLSVGQSVSVTMAMERTCGELRLADFDTLELTNYNRIRTGLHNLGLNKSITVAREIAEIDPYLKTVCFPEGISEENIDNFLTGDGKLDLLIDECDGLDIKILCRQKAKQLQIPVVMEASDRGTVDVERFDLEPDRSILHGSVDHLDVSRVKYLKTNEEKVPYLLPIAGAATLSKRAKASMLEVGQTITTWPQLASAVTMGGGIVTDVCRRIFLDEYHDSGRYFIDIEELIADRPDDSNQKVPKSKAALTPAMVAEYVADYQRSKSNTGINPGKSDLDRIVSHAIMAPSGGNAQPWHWHWHKGNALYLFRDPAQETHLVDYNSTASFISLGAATENLILTAHELGYEVASDEFPSGADGLLIAVFTFHKHASTITQAHIVDKLSAAIPNRIANRMLSVSEPVAKGVLEGLVATAATVPGAKLTLLTDEHSLKSIAQIIGKADRMRIMNKGGHADFLEEMVWTEKQARETGRGIEINSLDLTAAEKAGLTMATDWQAVEYLNKWEKGEALERASRKSAQASSAIGLITINGYNMQNFFYGGRAVERVWLDATMQGVAFQPLSISTFLFNRLLHEGDKIFSRKTAAELYEIRKEFINLFHIGENTSEILLFRLFKTEARPKPSFRVPLDQVFSSS